MSSKQDKVTKLSRFVFYTLILALASCTADDLPRTSMSGSVMGTQFDVTIVTSGQELPGEVSVNPFDILDRVSKLFSTYDPDSEISGFNRHTSTDWFPVSADFCSALQDALAIGRQTGGAFDISVGRLVNLWGFGPDGVVLEPPAIEDVSRALATTGYQKLHTDCEASRIRKDHPDLYVDLSGYAKGLAVDEIALRLDEDGYSNYLAELGGEIRTRGLNASLEPWRIAIEKPDSGDRSVQAGIRISAGSVATSGDYRNYFEHDGIRYSHTIDPRTGYPIAHALASVTVVGEKAAFTDAMATALLVMGPEQGLEFATANGLAAYFLVRTGADFNARMTPGFENFIER